ncbi:MAG: hypothetical protein ACRDM7_19550 [Thermoleophilaceae bacterium]
MKLADAVVIEYPDGHESKGCVVDGRPAVVLDPMEWRQDGDDAYVVALTGCLIRTVGPVRPWRKGDPW